MSEIPTRVTSRPTRLPGRRSVITSPTAAKAATSSSWPGMATWLNSGAPDRTPSQIVAGTRARASAATTGHPTAVARPTSWLS